MNPLDQIKAGAHPTGGASPVNRQRLKLAGIVRVNINLASI